MIDLNKRTTKEKIIRTAAKLFSEKGFDKVTVREIAKEVGVSSGALYNHFTSKEDILKALYNLYSEQRINNCPKLEELLALAEAYPPYDVLMRAEFHFNDDIRDFLDQILVTAVRRICYDGENIDFIRENLFTPTYRILRPLLERMVELGKIKPLDIDGFLGLLSYYGFASAALNRSPFRRSVAEYQAGMAQLFSLIVPIDS